MDLATEVYQMLEQFPQKEKFNLISQMERASVSIASNIAEGCGRHSNPAFKSFLATALGSAYELETQLILSNRLRYIADEPFLHLKNKLVEIQKMTFGLMRSLPEND